MNLSTENNKFIRKEIEWNGQSDYQLGSCLYMGMAYKNDRKVCISVGYTLSYCIKKADQFLSADTDLSFSHVSKIIIGEKKACKKYFPQKPLNQYYR